MSAVPGELGTSVNAPKAMKRRGDSRADRARAIGPPWLDSTRGKYAQRCRVERIAQQYRDKKLPGARARISISQRYPDCRGTLEVDASHNTWRPGKARCR